MKDAGEGSERIWRELPSLVSQLRIERPGMIGKAIERIEMKEVFLGTYERERSQFGGQNRVLRRTYDGDGVGVVVAVVAAAGKRGGPHSTEFPVTGQELPD